MPLKNDCLLKALRRQPADYTPIWIMRQAGRYLPEYREVRAQAGDFLTLCQTPELACEVTLQPLRRFDLDAAILFSDILTIPDAMGLGLHFVEGEGPCFHKPIKTSQDIEALSIPNPEKELTYVLDAIRLIKQKLNNQLPLIGFSGSPWTLACYMIEGHGSKDFATTKTFMYTHPEAMHQLLTILAESVIAYLSAQIKAGVDAIQIFDTWGGILTTPAYRQFSLHYQAKIVKELKKQFPDVPIILFTKNANLWLSDLAQVGCEALGVDWTIDLSVARTLTKGKVALQGNLDPALLYASPKKIREHAQLVLNSYGNFPGHVFNLGHGITPQANPEHVKVLVDSVHEFSWA